MAGPEFSAVPPWHDVQLDSPGEPVWPKGGLELEVRAVYTPPKIKSEGKSRVLYDIRIFDEVKKK